MCKRELIGKVSCYRGKKEKRLNDKNSQSLKKDLLHTHRHTLRHWFNLNYGSSCDIAMTRFNQILIANMGMIDTFACQTHFQAYVCSQLLTNISMKPCSQIGLPSPLPSTSLNIFVHFTEISRFDIDLSLYVVIPLVLGMMGGSTTNVTERCVSCILCACA